MVNLADLPNAGALSGSETLPMQQGAGAVKVTVNSLFSRAAGQVIPFDIGGGRVATISANGIGVGTGAPTYNLHAFGTGTISIAATTDTSGTARLLLGDNLGPSMGAIIYDNSNDTLDINASGLRAIRVTSTRTVLVGKTDEDAGVSGVEITQSGIIRSTRQGTSLVCNRLNDNGNVAEFRRDGTTVGSISVTGSNTAYNTTSDYRLPWKEGHTDIVDSGAFIDALNPRYFPLVGHAGFIAHEFQEVSPSSVTGEKDAVDENGDPIYQAMQASSPDVMANIIAELQSLRQRVAALEGAA